VRDGPNPRNRLTKLHGQDSAAAGDPKLLGLNHHVEAAVFGWDWVTGAKELLGEADPRKER
jgi:hypothetical protein